MKFILSKIVLSASVSLALALTFSCSSGSSTSGEGNSSSSITTKTALQYFTDEGVKVGWNLGNTLDAINIDAANAKAEETAWGNPVATQALINGVKQSGFNIVRIPCTWIGYIGEAPDYIIDETRLQRVAEVVNWVHSAGMKAIINIHHDGNYTQPSKGTWGFVDFKSAVNNSTKKNEIQEQIGKVWTQMANYFKDYGDDLIFETLNEVHSGNWGSKASTKEQDILFDWNQAALDAIRATGGNNTKRFVAVPGLGSTEPDIVIAAHNRGKLLPNDPGNGTDKLIVSVHFYAPCEYTVYETLRDTITQAELAAIDAEASHLKTAFIDKGIAVYYGEWGGPTNKRSSMEQTIKDTYIDYIRRVANAAHTNGIVPILWDDGGNFKMLERSNGTPKTGLWKDVLDATMGAVIAD